eukprot:CAMPEP_0184477920 /NCGR_PEP_ID=MMETSP0113_2-20130426/56_1 /TAXON_ID=91329 /ORGANISM="Norrisiella sphaerica, Strain BC52" /LENGTH=591 /DNA_ID=CAMNT_0026855527 /DNA_START=531 /DNA_END=2306 /DNA_ORIENTATION=+
MALHQHLKNREFYKVFSLVDLKEESNALSNSNLEKEVELRFSLSALGSFFKMYQGSVLREACYHVVDWPTQFDSSLVHHDPNHPHHIAAVTSNFQGSKVEKLEESNMVTGHKVHDLLQWERLVYKGSLFHGDRAVRANTPFPRLGEKDGLPEPFVMPCNLASDECNALRMFPIVFTCKQKHSMFESKNVQAGRWERKSTTNLANSCPSRGNQRHGFFSRMRTMVRGRDDQHLFSMYNEQKRSEPNGSVSCRSSTKNDYIRRPRQRKKISPGGTFANGRRGPESVTNHRVELKPGPQLVFSLIAYFEVNIEKHIPSSNGDCIAIGVARKGFPLTGKQPGWDENSFGYHGDDGNIFHSSGVGDMYGSSFGPGDIVGCGINYFNKSIFFTKNGAFLGTAFSNIPPGSYYPVVGVDARHPFRINFGLTRPFAFKLLIYNQQQMERQGLLSAKSYPRHPLLPMLEERVRAGRPRRNDPSPERHMVNIRRSAIMQLLREYHREAEGSLNAEDSSSEDEDEDWSGDNNGEEDFSDEYGRLGEHVASPIIAEAEASLSAEINNRNDENMSRGDTSEETQSDESDIRAQEHPSTLVTMIL